jgi:predicted Zn-dependent protease
MPRLTPLQWLVVAAFLAFYGFAVFALTRDYYLRHPPRPLAAAAPLGTGARQSPAPPQAAAPPTFIQREMLAAAKPTASPTGTDPEQINLAGDQLFGQQRYAEAIAYYRRALELAPGDADASNDLGLALFYTGQSSEALKTLRAGAEGSPDFQRIWLTLGFVSAGAGDQAGARLALAKARDLGPDNGIGQEAQRQLDRLGGN